MEFAKMFLPWLALLALPMLWMSWFGVVLSDPRRPFRYLVWVLFFGCLVTIPAVLMEWLLDRGLPGREQLILQAARGFLNALIEQTWLFLAVWLSVFRTDKFRAPVDGVLYATTAAMGFITVENFLNLAAFGTGGLGARLFYATPARLMFAAMWGCAMGMVCFNKKNELSTLLKGFCAAVILHGTWDLMIAVDPKTAEWRLIPMLIVMAGLVYFWVRKLRSGYSLPKVRDDSLVRCNLCGTCVMEGEEVCSTCGESVAGTGEVS